MSISLGRGRASMLRRSMSSEPQTTVPGGLQDSRVTSPSASGTFNHSPTKNIKPKLMTFQKPRPLKTKNTALQKPHLDTNNNSCASLTESFQSAPDAAKNDITADKAIVTGTGSPVNTNYVHCGQRLLITTSPGSALGRVIMSHLKTDFNVTPRLTGESECLHHNTVEFQNEKLVLTSLKSSTLVADVSKFLQVLNESLSAPSSSVKPAVVTNGSSLTKIRTSPTITLPQTDPPLSESAARPTTLSVDSTSQHSDRKITQDVRNMSQNVGNGRQFFRSNLEPAQAAKRPLESHTLPVMKVGTTLRFPVIDLTQSQNGPTTTLPESEEDWGEEVAGEEVPAFKFGAAQLSVTTYAMNQACHENRLATPEGVMSKAELKISLKKPMPLKERPKLDDAFKSLALNKDIRMLGENASSTVANPPSQQVVDTVTEDWGDSSLDIIVQPDSPLTSEPRNNITPLLINTQSDTSEWGSETSDSKPLTPRQSVKAPSNGRLKSDSWQNSRILNILSGGTERRKITPVRRSISTPGPTRQRKVSFADETSSSASGMHHIDESTFEPTKPHNTPESISDNNTQFGAQPDNAQSLPVFRFGASGAAAPPASEFTFDRNGLPSSKEDLRHKLNRSLSTEDKPFTRPWDSAKSRRYDFETNDWGSVRNSAKASKSPDGDSSESTGNASVSQQENWGVIAQNQLPVAAESPKEWSSSESLCKPNQKPVIMRNSDPKPATSLSSEAHDWSSLRNSIPLVPTMTNHVDCAQYKEIGTGNFAMESSAFSQSICNPISQYSLGQGDHFQRYDKPSWSRGDNWVSSENQRKPFSRNNSAENWEQAKGDNWRVSGFSRQDKNVSVPPRPYIASHRPLYTRQQLLVLSKTALSQSTSELLFEQPMDDVVRRDIYIIPPPQSSTGYQPMRKYFTPSDLKTPNPEAITPLTQRRHSDTPAAELNA